MYSIPHCTSTVIVARVTRLFTRDDLEESGLDPKGQSHTARKCLSTCPFLEHHRSLPKFARWYDLVLIPDQCRRNMNYWGLIELKQLRLDKYVVLRWKNGKAAQGSENGQCKLSVWLSRKIDKDHLNLLYIMMRQAGSNVVWWWRLMEQHGWVRGRRDCHIRYDELGLSQDDAQSRNKWSRKLKSQDDNRLTQIHLL